MTMSLKTRSGRAHPAKRREPQRHDRQHAPSWPRRSSKPGGDFGHVGVVLHQEDAGGCG
ncbi:hypothetical protein ACRAWD_18095 [Caulobacter segnis]